jgi:formylglycine-generating enzyme required for sulfatase activity
MYLVLWLVFFGALSAGPLLVWFLAPPPAMVTARPATAAATGQPAGSTPAGIPVTGPTTAAPTATPTATPTPPAQAPSASATATPTPTPPAIASSTAPAATPAAAPARMVLVPAGEFQMGAADRSRDEAPPHRVRLDAFYLDQYETTNAEYRRCAAAGVCTPGQLAGSFTRPNYRDDPDFGGYPVVGVTWEQAQIYCAWAGKRLPTEAEWEYAARGPQGRLWPWGNTFDPARVAASAADTEPVDAYEAGASPFGVFNLAGNVGEWVADAYHARFYAESPEHNPLAPEEGRERVYRGGSFGNPDSAAYRATRRYHREQDYFDVDIGFRCALSAAGLPSAAPTP